MSSIPPSYWHKTSISYALETHLPTSTDVLVIGGGLLGIATCYWLARSGISVVLIEREMPGAGATGRNGGFMTIGPAESYTHTIHTSGYETASSLLRLTDENRQLMRHVIFEEQIHCDYREPGVLTLALNEDHLSALHQDQQALQKDGVSACVLTREEAQTYIRTPFGPDIVGGMFLPDMGLLHPVRFLDGLLHAATRQGARAVHATAHHIRDKGSAMVVRTNRGTIDAKRVLVATNAWVRDLIPHLDRVLVSVRGQVLAYEAVPLLFPIGVSVDVTGTEEYWHQTPDGTILLGGCRAFAPTNDVGVRSSSPTDEVQKALEGIFPRLFPQLTGLCVVQRWAGLMAFTPDFIPIADRVQESSALWVVGGFCGHGMPFGLRVGQLLAEELQTEKPSPSLTPLRLARSTLVPYLS